jgi:hypothetical protein
MAGHANVMRTRARPRASTRGSGPAVKSPRVAGLSRLTRPTRWQGGGRQFESASGLCKVPANRRFIFRQNLHDYQRAVRMEPVVEPSGPERSSEPRETVGLAPLNRRDGAKKAPARANDGCSAAAPRSGEPRRCASRAREQVDADAEVRTLLDVAVAEHPSEGALAWHEHRRAQPVGFGLLAMAT